MELDIIQSEWLPSQVPSKKLIVVMHGRGDSPEGFRWLPDMLFKEEINYLLLQAPDTYYQGYSWYDLPPDQLPGILRSRQLLDKVFKTIFQQGYSSAETVVFGFSQGCLMTLEWGGRSHYKFAGMVGLSGYCYDEKTLAEELSAEAKAGHWLITHGTLDEVLPYARSKEQIAYLADKGLPAIFHSYQKAHSIEMEELKMLKSWIKIRLNL